MRTDRFRGWGLAVSAALGSLVGCAGDLDVAQETSQAIEGGWAESGSPAVGFLTGGSGGSCTAVLIAPSWAISTDHCQTGGPLTFYTGTSSADFVEHQVESYRTEYNTLTLLLHLAQPINTIEPVSLGASLPAPGTSCLAVGFGKYVDANGVATYGNKRAASEIVDSATPDMITVHMGSGIADHGDSGGPLLCNGFVDGICWGHEDGEWPQHSVELYTTIPVDWIQTQTGVPRCGLQSCASTGDTCGTVSDNCGGMLDCGTCGAGSQCSNNHCCPTGAQWNGNTCTRTLNCRPGWADCGGYCCRCTPTTCS
jgi:Trypsin